ncbi:hypothetical protein AVEN_53501-1 [Araneus ventricosus]|uniref:HTH CENPB-type domain-containing protein n=1 Tax=Araneus ventricosus TaxID=182803 RepID=A0A4Y2JB92_ARAVE|nr:hypothetical protein AVEN_53501-1 [Araneus ventricosus]
MTLSKSKAPNKTLAQKEENKDKILSSENGTGKYRKRTRGSDNPDVDGCVLKWFKEARDRNIPISGHIMRAKAEQFASALGKQDFKASTGWLNLFKD